MENHTKSEMPASPDGEMTSTRKLTKFVIYLSLVFLLLTTPADIYSSFFPITEEISSIEYFSFSIACLFGIPIIIGGLIWTYKTNKNSHVAGATGMTFSPGWACFLSCIPIVSYFVMQELWKTSLNPSNWRNEHGSSRIIWSLITTICSITTGSLYFVLYIVVLLISEGTLNSSNTNMIQHMDSLTLFIVVFSILITVTSAISFLLWLSVMPRISASQEATLLERQAQ